MDREKVGAFIREQRKKQKLTQKELAERLYLTDKAVSKWERGLSFPDITVLEQLAQLLDVSLFELMNGEARDEEKEGNQVDAVLADTVLTETVRQANRSGKSLRSRFRLIIGILLFGFFCLLLILAANRRAVSRTLDRWMEKAGLPWHGYEFSVSYVPQAQDGLEGFYLYRTETGAPHRFLYHVCGVNADGEKKELFGLEEYGMDPDRSPMLRADEAYVYVLFDGLDDENSGGRIYDGKVQADIQGFWPVLYRYDRLTGEVSRIGTEEPEHFLLMDAFTWRGESVWLESRFRSVTGGLDLGFYREDGSCLYAAGNLHSAESFPSAENTSSAERSRPVGSESPHSVVSRSLGTFEASLSGEGGLKTAGCLWDDSFYTCGPEGVYRLDLSGREETLVYSVDLQDCVRAEIRPLSADGMPMWGLICSRVSENSGAEIVSCRTEVSLLDADWTLADRTEFPVELASLEWGGHSAVLSGMEDGSAKMIYFDFADFSERDLTESVPPAMRKALEAELTERRRGDAWEQAEHQWVYLEDSGTYVFTGTDEKTLNG